MYIISPKLNEERAIATLIVGFHNKQVNIIDRAEAISYLFNLYGSTEEVSKKTNLEISGISRYLRVANLPESVKQMAVNGDLSSYWLMAELDRFDSEEMIVKVAKNLAGIPRYMGLEIIRYILKNREKPIQESVQYVIDSYGETKKIYVYFIPKTQSFSVYEDINPIQLVYFKERLHINKQEEFYIVVTDKKDVSKIRSEGYDVKKFLRTVISNE